MSSLFTDLKTKNMASCEKCWRDAYFMTLSDPMKGQSEHYQDLIAERKDEPCTPEQQAGQDAYECSKCKRMTMHQYAKVCTNCGS